MMQLMRRLFIKRLNCNNYICFDPTHNREVKANSKTRSNEKSVLVRLHDINLNPLISRNDSL
ncbi:hypothetical protein CUMW_286060, partial [Citrus unshiu]